MKNRLGALLIFSLLCVPVAPAAAQGIGGSSLGDPCNKEVRKMQSDHARAKQTQDAAILHQIVEKPREDQDGKPKSTVDLACLDQALRLTTLLSNLFSAMSMETPTITPNTGVFCGFTYPQLPTLSLGNHLNKLIGAWKPNWQNLLPGMKFSFCTPPASFNLPHMSMGGSLGGCLPNMNLGGGTLSPFKPQCIAFTLPGNMNCNVIKDTWKKSGSSKSVEGNGIITGVPYVNLQKLLDHQNTLGDGTADDIHNIGKYYKHQLENNANVLQRAFNNMIILKQPGGISSWPTVPHFSANANVQDIINGM